MKTMCPPGYHHNSFVATNSCTWANDVPKFMSYHNCGDNQDSTLFS